MKKRSLSPLLAAAFLFCGASLPLRVEAATSISFTFNNWTKYQTIGTGWAFPDGSTSTSLPAGVIGITVTALDSVPVTPTTIVAFCVELAEFISTNIPYTFNISPPTAAAAGYSPAVVRNARILYDLYYLGDSVANWTNQTAAAFQLALWELTHDTGDLTTGAFRRTSGASNSTVNLAQSWINTVLATSPLYEPFTELAALTNKGTPGVQDLYVRASLVPFSPSLLPGAAAVGLLAWLRRRRPQPAA